MKNTKNEVLIVGAGHQGLAMAAHLALNKMRVKLWNRSQERLRALRKEHVIISRGAVDGLAKVDSVSTDIEEVLCKFIMVTTPSSAHKDIAAILAPHMTSEHVVILNPGRTYGMLEFMDELKKNGCTTLPQVAEAQTIVYTCRREKENIVTIYALKEHVSLASFNRETTKRILEYLPECLRPFYCPADSWIQTSLGNVGMVLHCFPVLANIGWIENSCADFKYYYDGITKSIARVLEKIDSERVETAAKLGYEVETLTRWMKNTYHVEGDDIYSCLQNNLYYRNIDAPQSLRHRYIEEDIPCGLVPLEATAHSMGVQTPATTLCIDLGNLAMNQDFRKIGRKSLKEYCSGMPVGIVL